MKFKIIFTFFLPVLFFTGLSCNSPTEPKDNPGPDTTSHNFVWRVDTLGVYLSLARDVAIVNENDIWVVGEFYKNHSTFDSITVDRYNAAHWDGMKWTLKRVPIEINRGIGYGGILDTIYPELYSVFALQSRVIFSTLGVTNFENGKYNLIRTPSFAEPGLNGFSSNKIWAKDENNIWFVGEGGTILYFNGSTFTKIPYSTDVDFVDIWGDETGLVRAVANKAGTAKSSIVRLTTSSASLENEGLNHVLDAKTPDIFYTLWWKDQTSLFIGADNGFFRKQGETYKRLSSYYDIRPVQFQVFYAKGYANNDVFVVGNYGQVAHYNGNSIHLFTELPISNIHSELKALSVKKDIVCAVGSTNGKGGYDQSAAYIVLGNRVK